MTCRAGNGSDWPWRGCYFADAPIIICDEPSTGLDIDGEFALMNELAKLSRDRIVIVVTHRPETIARCDRTVVIDGGRVMDDGLPRRSAD